MKKITLCIGLIYTIFTFTLSVNAQNSSSEIVPTVAVSAEMQTQIEQALAIGNRSNGTNSIQSNLVPSYVGSFNTNDGPSWTTNPPALSAQEAAALIFGGVPSDYAISTNPDTTDPSTITHTAWASTWGIAGCQEVAENYSLDLGAPGYNDPGGNGTAVSAYVNDNCTLSNTNYVWLAPVSPIMACATDVPTAIDPPYDVTSTITITETGLIGAAPGEYQIDNLNFNIQDGWAGDLEMTLIAPSGATLMLSAGNGGGSGLDSAATLTFTDSSGNDVTNWFGGAPLADYLAEGGLLNTFFAGEQINGDWDLRIVDVWEISDGGSLNSFCLNLIPITLVGDPPVIACPSDIVANNALGTCGAVVNFTGVAFDTEDGNISSSIVATPPSGSVFPVGDTIVTLSVTDSDGNTSTCDFLVTVIDDEAPVAVCQDITIDLDPVTGMATITAADVDNGSTDNCGITSMTLDISSFDCSMVGENTVTLTLTDDAGNTSTCTSTVTIQDVTAPIVTCIGQPGTVTDTATTAPGVAIPDNSPAGIATTLTISDDFDITDLNVNLDISHTWIGDVIVSLESPAGTTAVLVDRMGYTGSGFGCGSNDLLITLDDQATLPIETECQPGPPAASGSFTPNNPLSVFNGESTLGDWILTVSDNAGGDTGTLNSWGLEYSHDVSASPLDVFLDANGQVTVNLSDLVSNVDEACGYTVTTAGVVPVPGNIQTLFNSNNNGNSGGIVYFDISVGTNDIVISDIDINTPDTGAFTMDVYTLVGTYVGNTGNSAPWGTPINASGTAVGVDMPSNAILDSPLTLSANTTYGMAIVLDANHAHAYSGTGSDPSPGQTSYSNSDVTLSLGSAANFPFDGSPFTPRIFNGNIHYMVGSAPATEIDFDCSNLGENTIEVMVTDDSGNFTTCTATINVIDNTPPVLVCQDTTIELGPDGTATVDPTALLGTLPTTYEVMVIGSDNGSGTAGFTDFTVNITEAANITFDWSYTANDSPGFDSFGYLLNGSYTELTNPTLGNQSGTGSVAVSPGDIFGFSSRTDDNLLGNNETVISNFMPGFTGQFAPANWTLNLNNSSGDAYFVEIPGGPLSFDACGITILAVDVTEVSCADIGTPITVTVFASDASGNIASCTSVITVVDLLGPEITCPADQTVDPGPGNLFYIVPDYFGTGEATADDNCTDPVTITSQDPAPGAALPDGTHTITLTATDEYGNSSTCTFQLTVTSVIGVGENSLDSGLTLYPNPADNHVNIVNKTNIALEKVMIYDINGKLVNQVDLRSMQSQKTIDVSNLATGVYMIHIMGDNANTVKRLIKE